MTARPVRGWCLLAFESELRDTLTPSTAGNIRVVIVRHAGEVRVVDGDCPHRGAHLAHGRLERDRIVCPFHGHRIGLGDTGDEPGSCRFRVREYPTLVVGGMVFARFGTGHEHGLEAYLTELDHTHYVITGFTMPVRAGAHWVTENALDDAHFRQVHGIGTRPGLDVTTGPDGELVATGFFALPRAAGAGRSGDGPVRVSYEARVYSPWLVVSALGGSRPYIIVTGATPLPDGTCTVRLALVAPPHADATPDGEWCREILRNSRDGLERDRAVWEHLSPTTPFSPTPQDAPVLAFRDFCRPFQDAGPAPSIPFRREAAGAGTS
ncbi:Rieske 2Fe-2S domain-containing protein [Pseudonocardia tropica]|uniref:Rieske-type oxygenase n=1 Tax=Pseudonocardia tropica TaxID=681289 RepID=A0ABV1K257_9PSEU